MSVIQKSLGLRRLRQDFKFEASLGYRKTPFQRKKKKKGRNEEYRNKQMLLEKS
jgi:hypothetical protein